MNFKPAARGRPDIDPARVFVESLTHPREAVAPRHRVWLRHTSGHMCTVNSMVLADIAGSYGAAGDFAQAMRGSRRRSRRYIAGT